MQIHVNWAERRGCLSVSSWVGSMLMELLLAGLLVRGMRLGSPI